MNITLKIAQPSQQGYPLYPSAYRPASAPAIKEVRRLDGQGGFSFGHQSLFEGGAMHPLLILTLGVESFSTRHKVSWGTPNPLAGQQEGSRFGNRQAPKDTLKLSLTAYEFDHDDPWAGGQTLQDVLAWLELCTVPWSTLGRPPLLHVTVGSVAGYVNLEDFDPSVETWLPDKAGEPSGLPYEVGFSLGFTRELLGLAVLAKKDDLPTSLYAAGGQGGVAGGVTNAPIPGAGSAYLNQAKAAEAARKTEADAYATAEAGRAKKAGSLGPAAAQAAAALKAKGATSTTGQPAGTTKDGDATTTTDGGGGGATGAQGGAGGAHTPPAGRSVLTAPSGAGRAPYTGGENHSLGHTGAAAPASGYRADIIDGQIAQAADVLNEKRSYARAAGQIWGDEGALRAYNGYGKKADGTWINPDYVRQVQAAYDQKPWLRDIQAASGARKTELAYINTRTGEIARAKGLDPDVLRALMWHESVGWQPGMPGDQGRSGGLGQVIGYAPPPLNASTRGRLPTISPTRTGSAPVDVAAGGRPSSDLSAYGGR